MTVMFYVLESMLNTVFVFDAKKIYAPYFVELSLVLLKYMLPVLCE